MSVNFLIKLNFKKPREYHLIYYFLTLFNKDPTIPFGIQNQYSEALLWAYWLDTYRRAVITITFVCLENESMWQSWHVIAI